MHDQFERESNYLSKYYLDDMEPRSKPMRRIKSMDSLVKTLSVV